MTDADQTGAGRAAPRGRGRPPSIDREAALDRAVDLFWELGYDGASLSELTRAMGLARPSLYNLFGDKDALFVEALERYGRTVSAPILNAFDTAPDMRSAVRAFLSASLCANTDPERPPGCLYACCAASVAPRMPHVAALLDRSGRGVADHVAARFAEATWAGEVAGAPGPRARAALLLDMMNAQAVRARTGATRAELEAGLEDRVGAVLAGPAMEGPH